MKKTLTIRKLFPERSHLTPADAMRAVVRDLKQTKPQAKAKPRK